MVATGRIWGNLIDLNNVLKGFKFWNGDIKETRGSHLSAKVGND